MVVACLMVLHLHYHQPQIKEGLPRYYLLNQLGIQFAEHAGLPV